ncbi:cyclic nucleotide-binding domain-containing protein [Dictyobacter arantiisoli]|uniref:Cyclic nucleotide-binding domain-containing protein n=1 Tax=Dictyobacter arantiisoli TaxID=2014874 RepID=A0A5A5TCC4_9CHLR|nr:cyclic nucleotide-binding domain-containing protein [Dictyobacter arantiisoli]GCF09160.1 hypothetical protein KDI_27240 [Dictyobacter arantiisoli]
MYEDALSRVDLFSELSKKELQALAKSCQERSYKAGSTIIAQGDSGVGLYIITAGNVHVTRQTAGHEEEDLGTLGAGNVLGEMALLDDLPRSATVSAVDDVTALLLPVWEFRSFLRDHTDVALKLLVVLSRRLRKAESQHAE